MSGTRKGFFLLEVLLLEVLRVVGIATAVLVPRPDTDKRRLIERFPIDTLDTDWNLFKVLRRCFATNGLAGVAA